MKKMKKTKKITGKDREVMTSMLSGEKSEKSNDTGLSLTDYNYKTEAYWKELDNMNKNKKINVDKAWNNLHSRIADEIGIEKNVVSIRKYSTYGLLRIAAVILFIAGLSFTAFYLSNSDRFSKELIAETNIDQKNLEILLPDGSKVILNRNTKLTYPRKFGNNSRNVILTGEAICDISPDSAKPFIIDAGKASVTVLGTIFNVITNNKVNAVEVFVQSGKVLLADAKGSKNMTLEPGNLGIINDQTSIKEINTDINYLSWNTELLVYSGQKLDVVFNDLKRVYNMDIVADDEEILENIWTSPIDNQSQETIIQLICLSFNLNNNKEGNTYHLSEK